MSNESNGNELTIKQEPEEEDIDCNRFLADHFDALASNRFLEPSSSYTADEIVLHQGNSISSSSRLEPPSSSRKRTQNLREDDPTAKPKRRARKQEDHWLRTQCLELVLTVESFECLWNHSIMEYRDRDTRQMAWACIAQALGRSTNDCKNKWACIRVNYKTTVTKLRKTKRGQQLIAEKKLPDPYSAMGFLDPMMNIQPVSRIGNLNGTDQSTENNFDDAVSMERTTDSDSSSPHPHTTLSAPTPKPTSHKPPQYKANGSTTSFNSDTRSPLSNPNNTRSTRSMLSVPSAYDPTVERIQPSGRLSDSFDTLGDFVASTCRDWHRECPLLAAEFRKEIVEKIAVFSGRFFELQQQREADKMKFR